MKYFIEDYSIREDKNYIFYFLHLAGYPIPNKDLNIDYWIGTIQFIKKDCKYLVWSIKNYNNSEFISLNDAKEYLVSSLIKYNYKLIDKHIAVLL
jgi:hypothetical protein